MNPMVLLDAMETIDDRFIISAQKRMGYFSETQTIPYSHKRNRPVRKAVVCIAAVIALLLASFTVAMAASEDFREFVFLIFNIEATETIPENNGNVLPNGEIAQIGGSDIGDEISTYYFQGNGVAVPIDGILYAGEYGSGARSFYDLSPNGLVALPIARVEFPYSFRGTDFNIKFDYTIYGDALHFSVLAENLNEDPYKYSWNLSRAGADAAKAWLLLPYDTGGDYGIYPMLLDVETKKITDILKGVALDGIIPVQWEFADDMSFALMSGYTEGYEMNWWICDIDSKTLSPISELTGRPMADCYLLDGSYVICYAPNESGFDLIRYDVNSGAGMMLLESTNYYWMTGNGSGFRSIEYYGGQGRHALLFDEAAGITLLDLLTGKQTPLEGVENDGTLLTSESPDGEHIMFAFRDTSISGSLPMYKIGVLDTQTGVLKILERADYQIRSETPWGWLANNCIVVLAYDEDAEAGWYMYVYDFK